MLLVSVWRVVKAEFVDYVFTYLGIQSFILEWFTSAQVWLRKEAAEQEYCFLKCLSN